MRLYRFDPDVGQLIDRFESVNAVVSRIVHLATGAQINCITLGPEGVVGYHPAAAPQLFLVVQGEGWVRGEAPERVAIHPGLAAFWEKGERHETTTKIGLTAIVIEGEALAPAEFMPVG